MSRISRNSLIVSLIGVIIVGLAFLFLENKPAYPISAFDAAVSLGAVLFLIGLIGCAAGYGDMFPYTPRRTNRK